MVSSKLAVALASLLLADQAVAANIHRHDRRHVHDKVHDKHAVVYKETKVVTITDWTTVTYWEGGNPYTTTHAKSFFRGGAHTPLTTTVSSSTSTSTSASASISVSANSTSASSTISSSSTIPTSSTVLTTSSVPTTSPTVVVAAVPTTSSSTTIAAVPTTSSTTIAAVPTTSSTATVAPVPTTTSTPVAAAVPTTLVKVASSSPAAVVPTTTTTPVAVAATTPTSPAAAATTPTTTSTPVAAAAATTAASVVVNVANAATTTAAAAATTAASSSSSSSSSGKRGLAYNDGTLLSPFLSSGSKVGWSYNWDSVASTDAPSSLEYVPMLWAPTWDHLNKWHDHANTAITNGAKDFLSFNECDNSGQCNLDASSAATAHIEYLNPYKDSVRIGTPAITNSGSEGEGVSWLKAFLEACDGNCAYDFCAAHWYSDANSAEFLSHLVDVHEACGKPVWVTEFAPLGASDDAISTFLEEVMDAMDNDSTYDFVERYSYFMAATDSLLSSDTTLSTYGKTYAYY